MKFKFSLLVALAALSVAGCAAYYSVFGLSQLFAGASLAVIIMAGSLEFSKIVAVSFLQRYWSKISHGLKTYLLIGVFVLVCITSAGIYGFLSNAYQKTASKLEVSDGEISVLNNKKNLFEKNISDNQKIIDTKTKRVDQLSGLRTLQENRLDSAKNNTNRGRARGDIDIATKEIQKLNADVDTINVRNANLLDSVNFYANKVIESKSKSTVAGEVGPLKYLAQLTGQPMDKVVNYFILLLIFVFDPLAVSLVIAANKVMELENKKREEQKSDGVDEGVDEGVKAAEISQIPEPEPEVEGINDEVDEGVNEPEVVEVESEPEIIEEPEVAEPDPTPQKKEPVIPNGRVELKDIKDIWGQTNRGFSKPIPQPSSNTIERIGANKHLKNGDNDKIFFKRKIK